MGRSSQHGRSVCSAALKMLCRRIPGVLLADKCDSWEGAQGGVRCLLLQGKEGPGCIPRQNNSLLIVEDSLNCLSSQPGTGVRRLARGLLSSAPSALAEDRVLFCGVTTGYLPPRARMTAFIRPSSTSNFETKPFAPISWAALSMA